MRAPAVTERNVMNFNMLKIGVAAAAMSAASAATAVTVDPNDFDSIFTEGQRTETVNGADVSGNAAVSGNGDVGTVDIPDLSGNTLIVGRVTNGSDNYTSASVTGLATITVLNYAEAVRAGASPFSAVFEFFAGGVSQGSTTLTSNGVPFSDVTVGSFNYTGESFGLTVNGQQGASDYDVSISIAAVPLPAAGLMLLGALGGLGVARRRKNA